MRNETMRQLRHERQSVLNKKVLDVPSHRRVLVGSCTCWVFHPGTSRTLRSRLRRGRFRTAWNRLVMVIWLVRDPFDNHGQKRKCKEKTKNTISTFLKYKILRTWGSGQWRWEAQSLFELHSRQGEVQRTANRFCKGPFHHWYLYSLSIWFTPCSYV